MALIALLERTPTGVLVKHLDVRGGRSVEDVADNTKAELVGRAMIEWWARGDLGRYSGTNWWNLICHQPSGPGSGSITYDLRECLRAGMTKGGRISTLAGALGITEHQAPLLAVDVLDRAAAIGRDLLAWWAEPAASRWLVTPGQPCTRRARVDLRIQINQAIAGYQHQRDMIARAQQAQAVP